MNPWLLTWGDLRFSAYFGCIALGLTLALFVLRREARRLGAPHRPVFDAALLVVPFGLVGSRLVDVVGSPAHYLADPLALIDPSGPLISWGAILGTIVGAVGVARWHGIDPGRILDPYGPAILFGQVFARLGCLASGCCHGRPADWPLGTNVPWAVRYHVEGRVPHELLAVPIHPSPLYESLVLLVFFVLLVRWSPRAPRPGDVFLAALGGYGAVRFVLEPFRGDLERGFVLDGWLSTGQVVGLALIAVTAVIHLARRPSSTPS